MCFLYFANLLLAVVNFHPLCSFYCRLPLLLLLYISYVGHVDRPQVHLVSIGFDIITSMVVRDESILGF